MPSMKPFILNQLLLLNEFHKTASINQHLVWPWVLFACIRWRGSIYQGLPDAVRVSVPPALHELPVSWLSASSLTIKISLACSLSELTVHTTCCFTPRSKGYISSFLLELSLKHWCCEPPPPSSCSSNSPSMLSSIDDVSSKKLSFTYCWVFFCVHMALSQHLHTVFLSIFHSS